MPTHSKAVLITGCSSGVGAATAERLARGGWTVYANGPAPRDSRRPRGEPYGAFNAQVATSTREVYEKGPLAKLGGPPESVAKAIDKAISARRPRTRYLVTPSVRVMMAPHTLLPDRAWDAFLRTQFPQPGKE